MLSAADRDLGFSPLIYHGLIWGGRLSYYRESTNRANEVELSAYSGTLTNQYDNTMSTFTGRLNAFRWYISKSDQQVPIVWGWSNQNSLLVRHHQSFSNFTPRFNYLTTFGPAISAAHHFKAGQRLHLTISGRVHMQWIGFGFHSSYVNSNLRGYEDGEANLATILFRSATLFYPVVHWHAGFSPALDVKLAAHRIRLMYAYEYLRLRNAHEFTGSRGEWSLSFIFAL